MSLGLSVFFLKTFGVTRASTHLQFRMLLGYVESRRERSGRGTYTLGVSRFHCVGGGCKPGERVGDGEKMMRNSHPDKGGRVWKE